MEKAVLINMPNIQIKGRPPPMSESAERLKACGSGRGFVRGGNQRLNWSLWIQKKTLTVTVSHRDVEDILKW